MSTSGSCAGSSSVDGGAGGGGVSLGSNTGGIVSKGVSSLPSQTFSKIDLKISANVFSVSTMLSNRGEMVDARWGDRSAAMRSRAAAMVRGRRHGRPTFC